MQSTENTPTDVKGFAPEDIVLYDDPRSARQEMRMVWISRAGWACFDEHVARHEGCTHYKCKNCGEPCLKSCDLCSACRNERDAKKANDAYAAAPKRAWNGEFLYSDALDMFFPDEEALLHYLQSEVDEDAVITEDLHIYLCDEVCASPIDADNWADDIPEDCDIPGVLQDAIDEFNEKIKGVVLSYTPSKTALLLEANIPSQAALFFDAI